MLVPVTMPVAVLRSLVHDRFGVSELATSLFMSINMIGAVVGAPLIGAFGDRLGTRKGIIAAALLVDALCFWLLTLPVGFGVFLGIRFFEGVAHIISLSALMALLADSTERHGRLMGMAGAGITLGVAVGAPLGGVLGRTDPLVPLYAGAALLVAVAALSLVVLPEPPRRAVRHSVSQLWRVLASNRSVAVPLLYAFVDRFTTGFFTTTFSLYLRRMFDLQPPQIGILIAYFMLPFSLLSYPVGRMTDRHSRVLLMCGGSALYGLFTASLGWWPVGELRWLMVTLGVLASFMYVPSLVMTRDLAPAEARATALGGFNAAGALGFMAGPLVGGWISQTVAAYTTWQDGYRAAFLVAGASELLCVAVTLPLLMRLRKQGRTT